MAPPSARVSKMATRRLRLAAPSEPADPLQVRRARRADPGLLADAAHSRALQGQPKVEDAAGEHRRCVPPPGPRVRYRYWRDERAARVQVDGRGDAEPVSRARACAHHVERSGGPVGLAEPRQLYGWGDAALEGRVFGRARLSVP